MIYSLHWSRDTAMTYTHGSQLAFLKDGSVTLDNALIAPGQAIRTWRNLQPGETPHEQMRLPYLKANADYRLVGEWDAVPESGVGLQVDTFDDVGLRQLHEVVNAHTLDFTYSSDDVDYRVALISMSPKTVHFKQLLLGTQADLEACEVTALAANIVVVRPVFRPIQLSVSLIVQPEQVPIQSLPTDNAHEQVIVSVPVTQVAHPQALAEQLHDVLVQQYPELLSKPLAIQATTCELADVARCFQAQWQK